MDKNSLSHLLDKKVSRLEFLQFVGGSLLVMFGVSNFMSHLSQFTNSKSEKPTEASKGFGTRKFGK